MSRHRTDRTAGVSLCHSAPRMLFTENDTRNKTGIQGSKHNGLKSTFIFNTVTYIA